MGIAVVLYFDEAGERRIRELWLKIAERGISGDMITANARPHLSLGAFEGVESDLIIERVRESSPLCAGQTIEFTSVATFLNEHGIVYLAPRVTPELLSLNARFHELFSDLAEKRVRLYTPGYWVPHCTLALNIPRPKVLRVIELVLASFEPFSAATKRIGFVEFYPIRYLSEQDIQIC